MATSDQPFDQALLYLRAAGHDTGADTRARLQGLIRNHHEEHPSLNTAQLLEKIPQWFDLPTAGRDRDSLLPPMARGSIGYPDE